MKGKELQDDQVIGYVVSAEKSPSTTNLTFVIKENEDEMNTVRKNQYVEVLTSRGHRIVAVVEDIVAYNPYMEDKVVMTDMLDESSSSSSYLQRWQSVYANARIIGEIKEGDGDFYLVKCFSPPIPGDKVVPSPPNHVKKLTGTAESGIKLGKFLFQPEVDLVVDPTKLLRKHLAILAMSGAGKSHTVSVIIEELFDIAKNGGYVPAVVVVDPHGEYTVYAEDANYARMTTVIKGREVSFSLTDVVDVELIKLLFPDLKDKKRRAASSFISKVREFFKEHGSYDVEDVLANLDSMGLEKKEREVGEEIMNALASLNLFSKVAYPNLRDIMHAHLYVIDLSDTENVRKKLLIVRLLTQQLFRMRVTGVVPPFLLVVEEAHNFVPSIASKYEALAKEPIETLAREGRKFYACLCLVSQRPYYLSQTALAQCNTHIIMRITNPNDLNHIKESSEGLTREALELITSLQPGEAVMVGEAVNVPVFVKIRKRKCSASLFEDTLEDAVRKWVEEKKKKQEDVSAFL